MIYDTINLSSNGVADDTEPTPFAGDSLTVQNFVPGTDCQLICVTATCDKAVTLQLTAPSFSDTSRGIRLRAGTDYDGVISHWPIRQRLRETEKISALIDSIDGGGNVVAGFCLHVFYANLPGRMGYYISPEQVAQAAVRSITIEGTLSAQTALAWGPSAKITSGSDLMRAQRPYALVGGSIQSDGLGLGIRAPDWANTRIVIPSRDSYDTITPNWFIHQSRAFGRPAIPVFNSGNKDSIYIEAAPRVTGNVHYVLHLIELSGSPTQYAARG